MTELRSKEQRQELNIAIGKRCKEARTSANLTQEKLAELLNVNSQFISDVERGRVGVSLLTLKNLSEILNVTTDYLIAGKDLSVPNNQLIIGNRVILLSDDEFLIMQQSIDNTLKAFQVHDSSHTTII